MKKLYDEGSRKVENNFNITKIIEDLRNVKKMIKLTTENNKLKYKIFNSHFINLDSEDEYLIEMSSRLHQGASQFQFEKDYSL